MQRPVASLMERQPEATAGGPNPSAGGPGEEAGKIARGLRGTQGDNSPSCHFPLAGLPDGRPFLLSASFRSRILFSSSVQM